MIFYNALGENGCSQNSRSTRKIFLLGLFDLICCRKVMYIGFTSCLVNFVEYWLGFCVGMEHHLVCLAKLLGL